MIKVRNWNKWQSYRKDRGTPPWIKIHRQIMSNPDWAKLSDAEKGQLISIWIVAADKNGEIPTDPRILRKVCQLDETPNINKFICLGFLESDGCQHDVNMTPDGCQHDAPEERRGEERREEKRREEEDGQASSSKRDQELISAFHDNRDRLAVLFPAINLDIAFEKMLATRSKSQSRQFLNPYEAIIKWMQMEFKPKAQSPASKGIGGRQSTFDAIDRVMGVAGGA